MAALVCSSGITAHSMEKHISKRVEQFGDFTVRYPLPREGATLSIGDGWVARRYLISIFQEIFIFTQGASAELEAGAR